MVAYGGHVWRPIRHAKQITKYQLTTRGQPQTKGRDRNNSRKGTGVPSKPVAKSEPGHFEAKSRACCCGKGNGSQSKLKLGKNSTTEYANSRWRYHGTCRQAMNRCPSISLHGSRHRMVPPSYKLVYKPH